ncbi:hypothetical protein [Nitratireductor pacificus]|uniref:hypothetical protein n=1 Tax=Nitratireductor pacificus TaxID=1231180 RepID=UPI00192CD348|nr:hypothetical protein [Nitratireductor pacificus]
MTYVPGQRLSAFLRDMEKSGVWSLVTGVSDDGANWQLAGSTWEAQVVVEPRRWIGLAFEARDPATGRKASYDIDTDLYDIRDAYRDFAEAIEDDIIAFLGDLRDGRVLRKVGGSGFVVLVPAGDGFTRITKGWVLTTSERSEGLRAGEEYVPIG